MKKVLIAAAVAGAFAAPSLMAADLSTNIYWGQGLAFGDNTTTTAGVDATTDINSIRTGGGNRLMMTWGTRLGAWSIGLWCTREMRRRRGRGSLLVVLLYFGVIML